MRLRSWSGRNWGLASESETTKHVKDSNLSEDELFEFSVDRRFGFLPVPLFIDNGIKDRWAWIYKRLYQGQDVSAEVDAASNFLAEMQSKLDRGFFETGYDWEEALRRATFRHATGVANYKKELERQERVWANVASAGNRLVDEGFGMNKAGRDFILAAHGALAFAMLSALSSSNALGKFGPFHVGLCLCGVGLLLLIPGTLVLIKLNVETGYFFQDQHETRPKWITFDKTRKVFFGRRKARILWADICIYGSLAVLALNAILMSVWLALTTIA
jgi:hypothetical protein